MAPAKRAKRTKAMAPSPTKKAKLKNDNTDTEVPVPHNSTSQVPVPHNSTSSTVPVPDDSASSEVPVPDNSIHALVKLIQKSIEKSTSPEQAKELHLELKKLTKVAEDKKFEVMKGSNDLQDGCLVELIESQQGTDEEFSTETTAKFTAGPKRTPFSITITDYWCDWGSGDPGFTVIWKSDLFYAFETSYGDPFRFDEIKQKDINSFLKKAGFGSKPVTRLAADGKVADAKMLKRFAYAEVINEALELLKDEHPWDRYPPDAVKLELGNNSIYPLMGLGRWKRWKENEREWAGAGKLYDYKKQLVLVSGAVLPPREAQQDEDDEESE